MMKSSIYRLVLTFVFAFATRLVRGGKGNSGQATWYQTGMGACGANSNDNDHVIALSTEEFGNHHCFKQVTIHHQGRAAVATIVDRCEGCSRFALDMSPGLFKMFAPLDTGVLQVEWEYEK